jgi:HSP20 family protein
MNMRSLIPWRRRDVSATPEKMVSDLRSEFDDLLNRFFGEEWFWPERYWGRRFSPAFDVSETDDEYIVRAELPGVDAKDVEVNLTGNVVTVRGEKKEEHTEKAENVHRVERTFGTFSRSFTLPGNVREENVKANFKDGVLTLKLPKHETAKKKTIKIDVD